MRLTQRHAPLPEQVTATIAFGEGLEIAEQRHSGVVLTRLSGSDHRIDARPSDILVKGQLVQPPFAGEGTCLLAARFLLGKLGGFTPLRVSPQPCRVVEKVGHGSPWWSGDGRGAFVAEPPKQLHPYGHSVLFDDATQRTYDWAGLRDKAIKRLRDAATAQPAVVDHLIGVLLDEGELDEAWQVAASHAHALFESRWQQIIELRQPTHPRDVIEPWQRLIQQRLDVSTDKYRYGKAIKMLRKLRDAYQATDDETGFGIYLDSLRDQHKRKTSFIAKLDSGL
ncbi:hypothetical protein [Amycolatopsis sp. NPDC051071]|uniref:hypothetical protein n=1 Tax=Amycolatopsis sp. NPDC051071 TaxID=3154637 RepID=UPI003437DF34